ncbi:acetoin utilization protein AcuC [Lederbergia citrea]|uniref:Acetoin utilization protein AcuC n=1 Tax=Lederbergia citrea TaxID=2833581 RepID=A0A942UL93_9BACI|nr:acetoin utilization protein AcuC [Lederbergia citrea]MBS4176003.1 acetoin utilization protein AcuC [Lederbergia citrea]MBS4202564.1 acetoin utilization protein AcuC [Lederbergia citrea]MBS4222770.1 acetoin utilization protein AcuC [Lederbergia citrea]
MKKDSIFVYSDKLLSYRFSEQHPFNQHRLKLTLDLLTEIGAIGAGDIINPRIASDDELLLNHEHSYIEAVKLAGSGGLPLEKTESFGIGTEDTPIFEGMHEASAQLVGGTLTAVDVVMQGQANHALHLGGGLHHGFRGKASGFCVYNDSAVAIKYLQDKYKARVLYVDTDAHHGDGVQWSFYDDDTVCTFSIHETGRYLFPGTGNVNEWGQGKGYGYSFNIPLDAFTEDESFIEAYSTGLREIADFFKPDVILTQNGADAHFYDPLTHLSTTMATYRAIPKLAHEIAHQYCGGKWIAVGGGGYDIWRVVPRAWSLIWLEMIGKSDVSGKLPEAWLQRWKQQAPINMIEQWDDPPNIYKPIPRKKDIEEKNRQTVDRALFFVRQQQKQVNKKNGQVQS